MRSSLILAAVLIFAAGPAFGATAPAPVVPPMAPTPVDIPLDKGALKSLLFRPEGPGPFPAVVALHGCDGLMTRKNVLGTRSRDWAEHLVKAGFVVLLPDSFGSRGLGSQCGVRRRAVRSSRERVADANAARHWLQAQTYIEPRHVTLLGWSTGANTVLWTVRRRIALAETNANDIDFRSAVALYPGCGRLDNAGWSARIPTLILIGAIDDWTPAPACQHMVAGARGRSAGTSIVVYPGAYHDFDHPNRPVGLRNGVALSASSTGTVHSGTNPVARADALKRVPEWLAR
ncbi:MAG TPA: dienelactone hydrolase family protein [Xanthobacteraceae bacterium]|nr:dienelactone hydrolase family protein [Xanthobacteraceae bacterium]